MWTTPSAPLWPTPPVTAWPVSTMPGASATTRLVPSSPVQVGGDGGGGDSGGADGGGDLYNGGRCWVE